MQKKIVEEKEDEKKEDQRSGGFDFHG